MQKFKHMAQILAAGLLLSHHVLAGPLFRRDDSDDALEQHLDMSTGGFPHGACTEGNDFSNPDSRADIWFHGHGGDLVEHYLRNEGAQKHDNVDWAQDIYSILFPNQDPGQMSCNGSADSCGIGTMDCDKDFHEWPAAFYMFVSLHNIHTFFAQYLERLSWMKGNLSNDMEVMVHDFDADGDSEAQLNVWAIVAAALGMSAGVTAESDLVSGVFNALSGFSNLIANINPAEGALDKLGAVKSNLAKIINDVCEGAYKGITETQDAIYGHEGGDESKIPQQMLIKDGDTEDFQHPTALALGRGQWLLDHPTEQLRQNFDDAGKQVKQTLALQLLRVFHKAYLVIFTESNEGDCNKGPNAAWNSDTGSCYNLVTVNHKSALNTDIETWSLAELGDVSGPLWDKDKYGADKLVTFKNIEDCWVTNQGKMGSPVIDTLTPGTDIKRCFFSVEVKKGKLNAQGGGSGANYLQLVSDDEFPNFSGEDKINHGGKPESCQEGKDCSQWPVNFNL